MKSIGRLILSAAGAIAAASLLSVPALGQPAKPLRTAHASAFERYGGVADHVNVRGGPFFATHQTLARVDSGQLGTGTLVDFEGDLGLETSTETARFDGYLRLGRRHQLRAGYISLSRGASAQLNQQIQWGNDVFDVNAGVDTQVNLVLVPLSYRFAVVKSDRVDFGLSAGVFALFADASVAAPSAGINGAESANFPLPVLGADIDIALAPRVFLVGGGDYFRLSLDQVDGSWSEFRGGLEVFLNRNVGVGAVYRQVNLNIDGTGALGGATSGTDIFFDYEFKGPQVYLTLAL